MTIAPDIAAIAFLLAFVAGPTDAGVVVREVEAAAAPSPGACAPVMERIAAARRACAGPRRPRTQCTVSDRGRQRLDGLGSVMRHRFGVWYDAAQLGCGVRWDAFPAARRSRQTMRGVALSAAYEAFGLARARLPPTCASCDATLARLAAAAGDARALLGTWRPCGNASARGRPFAPTRPAVTSVEDGAVDRRAWLLARASLRAAYAGGLNGSAPVPRSLVRVAVHLRHGDGVHGPLSRSSC